MDLMGMSQYCVVVRGMARHAPNMMETTLGATTVGGERLQTQNSKTKKADHC
jgi:hypothetical protein